MFPEHSGEEQVSGVCQMAKSVPLVVYVDDGSISSFIPVPPTSLLSPTSRSGPAGQLCLPGTFGMSQAMLQMRLGVDAAFATSGFE